MKTKLLSIVGACLLTCSSLYAQTGEDVTWTKVNETEDVSISYTTGTCGGHDVLYVRISNNNGQPVQVDWTLWNDGNSKTIELGANESFEGACMNMQPQASLTEHIPTGKSITDMDVVVSVQIDK